MPGGRRFLSLDDLDVVDQDRLRVMPAVVVTGARQTGKSTLARELMPGGRCFLSLDDLDVVDAAAAIPRRI